MKQYIKPCARMEEIEPVYRLAVGSVNNEGSSGTAHGKQTVYLEEEEEDAGDGFGW